MEKCPFCKKKKEIMEKYRKLIGTIEEKQERGYLKIAEIKEDGNPYSVYAIEDGKEVEKIKYRTLYNQLNKNDPLIWKKMREEVKNNEGWYIKANQVEVKGYERYYPKCPNCNKNGNLLNAKATRFKFSNQPVNRAEFHKESLVRDINGNVSYKKKMPDCPVIAHKHQCNECNWESKEYSGDYV